MMEKAFDKSQDVILDLLKEIGVDISSHEYDQVILNAQVAIYNLYREEK